MDPHPRAHVPVLVRSQAEPVRGRRKHGEAGALRPQRDVPQERREPAHRPPARQGARAHRRRRVEAPPQGHPPRLQHGQAQGLAPRPHPFHPLLPQPHLPQPPWVDEKGNRRTHRQEIEDLGERNRAKCRREKCRAVVPLTRDMKITLRGSTLVHNLDNPNIQEHCLTPASLECKTMERVLCRCFTPTHFLKYLSCMSHDQKNARLIVTVPAVSGSPLNYNSKNILCEQERTFDTGLSNAPAGQCSHPFGQQQPPAMPSSQGLVVNMSYTQMLLAADSEAAYFGSPTHAAIPLVLRTRRS